MSTNIKNWFSGKKLFAAAILIGFFIVFFFNGFILKKVAIFASLFNNLKNKETVENNQDNGLLGGPVNDESLVAQAIIDFSADDEAENIDFSMMQENSIIASTNPSLINPFTGFSKEITIYSVRAGDIPEQIAVSFGINTNTLLWANNLRDGDLIRPGDKLIILPINSVRHKAQSGDTIAALAKKYQADAEEIKQFNSLVSDQGLKVGDYIIIPDGEMPAAPKPKVAAPKFVSNTTPSGSWLIMPIAGRNWGRLHSYNAVDIAGPCGTPIYAAAAGTVILADGVGWNGGYGKYIKIQHPNGVVTLYSHNRDLLVEPGQSVSQGQLIALVGATGRSTGCHVHFEVRGAKNPFVRR